jgi:hypothetical protein
MQPFDGKRGCFSNVTIFFLVSGTRGREKIQNIVEKPDLPPIWIISGGEEFIKKKGCANPSTIVSFQNLKGGRRDRIP